MCRSWHVGFKMRATTHCSIPLLAYRNQQLHFDKVGINQKRLRFHHNLGIIVCHSSISPLMHNSILRLE
jgi:hypothetical protein